MVEQPVPRKRSIRRWLASCQPVGLVTLLALDQGMFAAMQPAALYATLTVPLSCLTGSPVKILPSYDKVHTCGN